MRNRYTDPGHASFEPISEAHILHSQDALYIPIYGPEGSSVKWTREKADNLADMKKHIEDAQQVSSIYCARFTEVLLNYCVTICTVVTVYVCFKNIANICPLCPFEYDWIRKLACMPHFPNK